MGFNQIINRLYKVSCIAILLLGFALNGFGSGLKVFKRDQLLKQPAATVQTNFGTKFQLPAVDQPVDLFIEIDEELEDGDEDHFFVLFCLDFITYRTCEKEFIQERNDSKVHRFAPSTPLYILYRNIKDHLS